MSEGLACVAPMDVSDTVALGRLYDEHARRLRGLLVRLGVPCDDANDALHEVFAVACRRLGTLREPSAVVAWLNGIAVRVAASARRRARWRHFIGLEEAAEPVCSHTPASALESHQARAVLQAALDGLSDKKRTGFILFEPEGLSGEEIAEAVGCPLKTVRTRLYHARRELVARLALVDGQYAKQGGQPS